MTASDEVLRRITTDSIDRGWAPPIHDIEKWWTKDVLHILSHIMYVIEGSRRVYSPRVLDLLKIAFCRVMITHSSASFNHQSMSFKKLQNPSVFHATIDDIAITWRAATRDIHNAAQSAIYESPRVMHCDARELSMRLPLDHYTCVITSPPYPNRMSYIRELRPYMYWLGYLKDGREAGHLDWQAIGGTWGVATSKVSKWVSPSDRIIPYENFPEITGRIATQSDVLSRYVHKYFYDMMDHINELFLVAKSGASIHYIVGNSKFYDVLLPVEEIFAALFEASGFRSIRVSPIRKRTSKKELYEYIVSASKP
ncbi:MAG: SAM-dependent methyltransferase [Anaerolineae bacterium]